VQFPDVSEKSASDVATIDIITQAVERSFSNFKLGWLVREFEENLPKELDFQQEAANANRIRECFKDDPFCTTPEIYKATKRLLIMEFIDGVPVNEPESIRSLGINPSSIVHNLNRVFNEQIFLHRFTHCDPHPGNVLGTHNYAKFHI
jgi:aarF domain-containing kinase